MPKPAKYDLDHLRVFIGADTIAHYSDPSHAPLVVGKQRLSYVEVAQRTGLPAARSAANVTQIAAEHDAVSIRDLYRRSSPSSVAVTGFGTRSLLMLFKLFESEGLSVREWAQRGKHWRGTNGHDSFSTFDTYKKRELAAEKRTASTAAAGPREKGYRRAAMRAERRAK